MQSPEFADIVSYTTRQPRQNKGVWEREGIDYNYIDEATAARLLESHAFVEAKFVHGTVYGTGVKQIEDIRDAGKIAVTDINVQGGIIAAGFSHPARPRCLSPSFDIDITPILRTLQYIVAHAAKYLRILHLMIFEKYGKNNHLS